ncbi:MAG: AmmeMemoRadiSam system radical SAM enzyme [Candidatus Omnitrophica bacterium]|nr:AmmeMemoRadiSam system radical SAM enzyme [Candidatus Omnitrophota bacterium]MDD4012872.1 AmmeMemoRadiSam system radical SAM enzyme [Candidatus Omnitrophota bacterium]
MKKIASLWGEDGNGKVRCSLCEHRCIISEGKYGYCGMRRNEGGELYTYAYGRVVASNVDPIEKKPFYHFLPGSRSYSVATAGCNFKCAFCQNWTISQTSARDGSDPGRDVSPEGIVGEAIGKGCRSISYTYTEPTIFLEFARDIGIKAKAEGLKNNIVTNGYMTPEALHWFRPVLDAANIDLKSFRDDTYRRVCGGSLNPVLASIDNMKMSGVWVEVTTLVVPGLNDSAKELKDIALFLASVGSDIPWHISRFHPDHLYTEASPTPMETMRIAFDIGREAGLKYVYLGNANEGSDTRCPECGTLLIERGDGFTSEPTGDLRLGRCVNCGFRVDGVW